MGRNGSGKSTLLKVAAGLLQADSGTRFVQPGATVRYLPQEPDLSGYPSTLAYVEAGMGPGDDLHRARSLLDQLGLTGEEDPAHLSGGQMRRCALARTLAPSPRPAAAGRADQPPGPARHRVAGSRAVQPARRPGAHQPRPAPAGNPVPQHRLAGWRRHPPDRPRLQPFRGVAGRGRGANGARPAQAGPADRPRGGLAALRRHRPAQSATCAAWASWAPCARSTGSSGAATEACACKPARPTCRASWWRCWKASAAPTTTSRSCRT